jgi:hypothetical protein
MPTLTVMLLASLLAPSDPAPQCSALELSKETAIHFVGAYTNMRYTEEHAYGYSVHLWRAGRCFVGLFMASDGLAGDTPTGLLEAVRYDQSTGFLSFRSRLTEGLVRTRDQHDLPSRDRYEFTGRFDGRGIHGRLVHTNAVTPSARPLTAQVVLQRSTVEEETAITAATVADWQRQVAEVLRRRGPRW